MTIKKELHHSTKRALLGRLSKLYPEPASELNFRSPYQLTVCVMLSAQCTDKKVNEVTPALFARYPSFSTLSKAKPVQVEKIIHQVNYYRTKAKNLVSMAKAVQLNHKGRLPRSHAQLTELAGVGNKSANVILNEMGIETTFPVDTHVFRVSKRLCFASGKNVKIVEEELKENFDSKHWRNLHHWLILHGRRVCKARRPLCEECALKDKCPSAGLGN